MDNIIRLILMTAVICMGGSAAGAAITSFIKRDAEKTLGLFLGFAGGLTLGIVGFDLIPEAVEHAEGELGAWQAVLCVILGYAVIWIINLLMGGRPDGEEENCCHCHCHSDEDSDSLKKLFIAGLTMAFAIALHNIPVGMIIGSTFASSQKSALLLSLVIALHNIPEGMAVAVPMITGGAKKSNAIIITSLTGIFTVAGALAGYFIGSINPIVLSVVLGIAAGAMIYVSTCELIPKAISSVHPRPASLSTLLGIILAMVIIFI